MASSQQNSGRLKKADQAGTTYQGSAQSGRFNAVQAVNDDKAAQQRMDRIIQDGDTKRRQLQREQDAFNTYTRAEQNSEQGLLKLDQQKVKDDLDIQQKYDQNTLKQQHTFEENKMALESTQLRLDGQVSSARTQVISTGVQSLLSLSSSYLKYQDTVNKQAEQDTKINNVVNETFNIESGASVQADAAASTADRQNAVQAVQTEDAVQASSPDPVIQDGVRDSVSGSTIENQQRRSSAFAAAGDFGTFFTNWTADTSVVYTRADGSQFTSATMRDSVDVKQVSQAAKQSFYGAAGLDAMPRNQIANTVVPTVQSIASSWENQTSKTIAAGNQAERLRSAQLDIVDSLNSGTPLEEIFQNGFSAVFGSGGYVGNKGGATEDTLKMMLDWAVKNNKPEVIEALKGVHKRLDDNGNPVKGTQLGRQYVDLFEAAENGVIDQVLTDDQRTRRAAENAVVMGERDRKTALAEASSPEAERAINLSYADYYDGLGTPEGDLKGEQLRATPNYSPFTATDIAERQEQGEVFTNPELGQLVEDGEITAQEAQKLGWNKSGAQSTGTEAANRAKGFQSEFTAQGTRAVNAAIKTDETLDGAEKTLLMQGQGKSIINNIADRISNEVRLMVLGNPDVTDQEIRTYVVTRGAELAADVTLNEDQLVYNFQTANGTQARTTPIVEVRPSLPSPTSPGVVVNDYRGYTPEQLRSASNLAMTQDIVLTQRDVFAAQAALRTGKPLPSYIEEKASALGTNGTTFIRAQARAMGFEVPLAEANNVSSYTTDNSSTQSFTVSTPGPTAGAPSDYDTGVVVGGVSVDGARKSIITGESGGNFTAVNPHSGALGFAQVMPENVGPWSREVLGRTISQREFLRSPELQMQIINGKLEQYFKQEQSKGHTGDVLLRRVASLWYSGQAGLYNSYRPEYYNGNPYPSIGEYTEDALSRYRAG